MCTKRNNADDSCETCKAVDPTAGTWHTEVLKQLPAVNLRLNSVDCPHHTKLKPTKFYIFSWTPTSMAHVSQKGQ